MRSKKGRNIRKTLESQELSRVWWRLLKRINLLSEQITEYDKEIKLIMDQIDTPILSIPGIGCTLGAIIIAEIGNIGRFSSPAKLLAFAGLKPSIYQPGKFMPTSGKMVKRGSLFLR